MSWQPGLWWPTLYALVVSVLTVRKVYRGGVTANDHAVALVVLGCVWIWPALWWGAIQAGVVGAVGLSTPLGDQPGAALPLMVALALGCGSIYALFHVLDRRVEAGPFGMAWARLAQPAYAFSLWTGLLYLLWWPVALLLGRPLLWPGWLLLVPLVLAVWGSVWTWGRRHRLTRLPLPGRAGLAPLTLVQLSDLHACPTMTGADLDLVVDRVNDLEPDLVCLTGDFLMPYSEQRHPYLLTALARLRAPGFACPGNHDLPVLATLRAELAAIGIPLLTDEQQRFEVRGVVVELVGVNFHWREARPKFDAAVSGLPPLPDADWRVLMAHDPRLFRWVPPARFDLVLSGHTHGGQVGFNMFGVAWSLLRPFGVLDQGLWRRGEALLYVHSGNWHTGLPPRMGIAGEIAVVTLGAPNAPRPLAKELP